MCYSQQQMASIGIIYTCTEENSPENQNTQKHIFFKKLTIFSSIANLTHYEQGTRTAWIDDGLWHCQESVPGSDYI